MGYRSEVTVTMYNADFINLVGRAKSESETAYQLLQAASIYQTDKFTTLHFDWIKWYTDYDDIKFIEGFLYDVPYVFRRVGESCDDIECFENDIADYDMLDCVYVVTGLDIENAGVPINLDGKAIEEGVCYV